MPKSYDFTFFSQKCKYDFLHTLIFSATIVIYAGIKTKALSILKLSTLSQKKSKETVVQDFWRPEYLHFILRLFFSVIREDSMRIM